MYLILFTFYCTFDTNPKHENIPAMLNDSKVFPLEPIAKLFNISYNQSRIYYRESFCS